LAGFVLVGGLLLIFAGLMALFPRRIPTKYSNAEAAKKRLQAKSEAEPGLLDGFKGLLATFQKKNCKRICQK
jgi:hypothetical protein